MIAIMAALKGKSGWERKVFDESKVDDWRTQALQFGRDLRIHPPDDRQEGKRGVRKRQKMVSAAIFAYVS